MAFPPALPTDASYRWLPFKWGAAAAWAALLSSCQSDPYGYQHQQASNYQQAAAGQNAVHMGRRLRPGETANSPAPAYSHSQTATGQWPNPPGNSPQQNQSSGRWNSGQTWAQRAQGEGANWRGAGVAWQKGIRHSPGHYSQNRRSTPPSTPASNWQSAPFYRDTPAARTTQAPDGRAPTPAPVYSHGTDTRQDPLRGQSTGTRYIIQKGDTLSEIARRHRVPMAALLRANGLTRDQVIYPGQPLMIPGR